MLSLVGISMLSVVEALSPFLPGIFSLAVEKGLQYLDFEAEGGLKQLVPYIVALIFHSPFKFIGIIVAQVCNSYLTSIHL